MKETKNNTTKKCVTFPKISIVRVKNCNDGYCNTLLSNVGKNQYKVWIAMLYHFWLMNF